MTDRSSPAQSANVARFILDGEVHAAPVASPVRTVLQYLREDLGRSGTKEGCAEGDCGACTVVVAEAHEETLRFRAVNACIQFLPTLDGKALFTVESLKDRTTGVMHPVQQAMADGHGAQCGFCTPGFVMSLFALYKSNPAPDRTTINDALAGNLCRCTGYRPIVDAAIKMHALGAAIPSAERTVVNAPAGTKRSEAKLIASINGLAPRSAITTPTGTFHAPRSVAALATLRAALPKARILAGGTDVGLWVTKQYRALGDLLYLGNVAALAKITVRSRSIDIGAAVSLTDAFHAIEAHIPAMRELMRRFASPPIRNAGTLVGNIANGSPIGDSMPPLIALGATVILAMAVKGRVQRRELALEDFYLAYQQTALKPKEFVERVRIPIPPGQQLFATYKISKRFDQDISAVCAAFALDVSDGAIRAARVAFGGMAATPKRALQCERVLIGANWTAATCEAAALALAQDFAPLSDMRASAGYRLQVAQNLLRKFHLETIGALGAAPSRLYDFTHIPA